MRRILSILILCLSATAAHGAVLEVPGDYPTIAAAIAASASGDEIVIAAGTYVSATSIPLPDWDLTIRGEGEVILTGCTDLWGAYFDQVADLSTVSYSFENLSFVGNRRAVQTPANTTYSSETMLDIENCRFIDNVKAGVSALNSGSLFIRGCEFVGGEIGVNARNPDQVLQDCLFDGQSNLAIRCEDSHSFPHVAEFCTFLNCEGVLGTLYTYTFFLRNCTVVGCGTPEGSIFWAHEFGLLVLENNIVTDCQGRVFNCSGSSSGTEIRVICCDLWNNVAMEWGDCIVGGPTDNGNFSADPLFCEPAAGDFGLAVGSPCSAEYNDCGVLVGAHDEGCGATSIDPTATEAASISAIKTLY